MTTTIYITKSGPYNVRVRTEDQMDDGSWVEVKGNEFNFKGFEGPADATCAKTIWKNRPRRLIVEEVE